MFAGEVRYARDAFEGLRLMDALMAVKRGEEGAALPAPARAPGQGADRHPRRQLPRTGAVALPARSDVAVDVDVPTPPFWGDRIVKGIALADVAAYLDERATFMGQWGLKGSRSGGSVRTRSWSRPRAGRGCAPGWTGSRPTASREFAVVYGYWPCYSEGDELVVLRPGGDVDDRTRAAPVHASRGSAGRATCAWPTSSATASWRWPKGPTWSRSTWSPWVRQWRR